MVTMLIALFFLLSLRKVRTMQNISENKELPFLWGIFIGFLLKNDELILPDFYTWLILVALVVQNGSKNKCWWVEG